MTTLLNPARRLAPLLYATVRRVGLAAVCLVMIGFCHPAPRSDAQNPPANPGNLAVVRGNNGVEGKVVLDSDGSPVAGAEVVMLGPSPLGRKNYVRQ